ncbi:MarR family winged helix-turn-helix transcriptional regulator [Modicisalibacter radicis]|uniref:MarR family winged helix-turn-helix transcriptional regulator n=1 Tax=Halomonas sp. EAR18 TaxID=2518972 RepID=UPI001FCE6BD8|nr:winged helix-turn-helix transcriptional regulator [Halomonas sp. EAR18]
MSENLEPGLVRNFSNLQNKIQKKVGAALSAHGVGLSEYLVLNQLYVASNQNMRRSDLAEQVGLSPSGVTRLLNPMEKWASLKSRIAPAMPELAWLHFQRPARKLLKRQKFRLSIHLLHCLNFSIKTS